MSADDKKKKDDKTGETKYSASWWCRWIKAAKKDCKENWADAKAAYDEYETMGNNSSRQAGNIGQSMRGYPIYAISSRILAASYFGQKPKIKSRRLNGIDDGVGLTMSFIVDRLGQYCVDNGDFLEAMMASVDDFIHASKGTPQVIYETEIEDEMVPLTKNGEQYYEEGAEEEYTGEVFKQDDVYFYKKAKAVEETQRIYLSPLPFDDYLITPKARTHRAVTEMAFRFELDKHEAEEKFNKDGKRTLPYKNVLSDAEDDENSNENSVAVGDADKKLFGWECYCKRTKKVYWICEDYKDGVLLEEDDPMGLRDFFPVPKPAISGKRRKSCWGTPVFVYVESTLSQLHDLYYRIRRLIKSIKRKALVDGLAPEVVTALSNLDGEEFLSIGSMAQILEKGGIDNIVMYLPVAELVQALNEASNLEEKFKQNFYEFFRLPDVLRGTGDPAETLGAQELQQGQALDSFKVDRASIIELARESAEIIVDLALRVFSDKKIKKICGFDYLPVGDPGSPGSPEIPATPEIPAQPPSPQFPQGVPAQPAQEAQPAVPPSPPIPGHRERFDEALAKLKDDEERIIRVDFETESTSFRDDQRELQRQTLISQTVTQGLNQIVGIEDVAFRNLSLSLLLGVVETLGGSSKSEDMIKKVIADLDKAKNAPPPPPPPDYEQLKVDVMRTKAETEAQKVAIAAQAKERELAIREMEVNLKGQKQNIEAALSSSDLQRQTMKDQFEARLKEYQAQLDQALVSIEQQRVQIDAFQAQASVQESLMEEARLAKQVSQDALAKVAEFIAMQPPQAEKSEPVVQQQKAPDIHIHMPGAMRKKLIYDEMGQLAGTEDQPINGGV